MARSGRREGIAGREIAGGEIPGRARDEGREAGMKEIAGQARDEGEGGRDEGNRPAMMKREPAESGN